VLLTLSDTSSNCCGLGMKYECTGGGEHERDNVFNLGVDWRIILKWIVKKWDGKAWTVGEGVMNLRVS